MAIGNYDRSMEAYQLAVKYSRPAASIVSEMLSISRISLMALQQGRLRYAHDTAIQGIERAEKLGVLPPITAAVYGACGQVCYFWAELEQARKYLRRSVELSALSGHNAALSFCKANLSRLFQMEGDIERAALEMREAHEVFQLGAPAWILPELVSQQARLYVAQNRLGEIEPVLKRYGFLFADKFSYDNAKLDAGMNHFTGLLYNSALRVLLHKAQSEQGGEVLKADDEQNFETHEAQSERKREYLQVGIELADRLINAAVDGQVLVIAIETLLLCAKMHYILGNREAYRSDVARAVKLAEPEGFVSMFVEEGQLILEAIHELLKDNKLNPAQSEFVGRVMDAASVVASTGLVSLRGGLKGLQDEVTIKPNADAVHSDNDNQNADAKIIKNQQSGLVDPLTDRELEVLRLMSEGLKYGEIAEELFISLNTVRSHVKSAYSKLNVNNRTQALDVAHRLQLI
jgi:LuxR family maltose regulon positive regulatory protein